MSVSLVLLAGGRGARLGGRDKGLLVIDGRTLVEQLLSCFAPQVNDCWVIANRHQVAYRRCVASFGAKVIEDRTSGFQGPLVGILTGLERAAGEWVLVLPCDVARLPANLLSDFWLCQQRTQARAVFASAGGQDYPVCCLLQRSLVTSLEQAFLKGERSPVRWLATLGASRCDFPDAGNGVCWSINTPEELLLSGLVTRSALRVSP